MGVALGGPKFYLVAHFTFASVLSLTRRPTPKLWRTRYAIGNRGRPAPALPPHERCPLLPTRCNINEIGWLWRSRRRIDPGGESDGRGRPMVAVNPPWDKPPNAGSMTYSAPQLRVGLFEVRPFYSAKNNPLCERQTANSTPHSIL